MSEYLEAVCALVTEAPQPYSTLKCTPVSRNPPWTFSLSLPDLLLLIIHHYLKVPYVFLQASEWSPHAHAYRLHCRDSSLGGRLPTAACGFSLKTTPTCAWTGLHLDPRASNLQQKHPLPSIGSNMRSIVTFLYTEETWWMLVKWRAIKGKPP